MAEALITRRGGASGPKVFYSDAYKPSSGIRQFSFGGSATSCWYADLPIADIGFEPRIVCTTHYSTTYRSFGMTYIDLSLLDPDDQTSGGEAISTCSRYRLYLNDPNRTATAVVKNEHIYIPLFTSAPGAGSTVEIWAIE